MAPIAITQTSEINAHPVEALKAAAAARKTDLSQFSNFQNTPVIGTEFTAQSIDGKPVLNIQDVLKSPEQLAALGRLVSERGVVFFRKAKISTEEQKALVQALGVAGGKPATSGLHVHPLTQPASEFGDEITHVSNKHVLSKEFNAKSSSVYGEQGNSSQLWHSDIQFEPVPSDYASLVIRDLPVGGGGDTLWASAYEAYDRLSPALQKALEGLSAVYRGDVFIELAKKVNLPIRDIRGAPENNTTDLQTVHPVIRTNPVTGWKGLMAAGGFARSIVELTKPESEALLKFLSHHISGNHDLQVRFRWEEDSLAIWDNRSTFHSATPDVGPNLRQGTRSVSLGERPYLDPNSKSRRADLAEKAAKVEGQ